MFAAGKARREGGKEGGSGRSQSLAVEQACRGGTLWEGPPHRRQQEAIAPPGPLLPRWVLPTSPDSFCWTWSVYECGYVSKGVSVCVEGSLLRGYPHGGCFWVLVSLAGRIHGHGIALCQGSVSVWGVAVEYWSMWLKLWGEWICYICDICEVCMSAGCES